MPSRKSIKMHFGISYSYTKLFNYRSIEVKTRDASTTTLHFPKWCKIVACDDVSRENFFSVFHSIFFFQPQNTFIALFHRTQTYFTHRFRCHRTNENAKKKDFYSLNYWRARDKIYICFRIYFLFWAERIEKKKTKTKGNKKKNVNKCTRVPCDFVFTRYTSIYIKPLA